jgi:hypothetical protein
MISEKQSRSRPGGRIGRGRLRSPRAISVLALNAGLVAAVAIVAGPVSPASAQTGPGLVTTILSRNAIIFSTDGSRAIMSQNLNLRAGESRRVLGQIEATLSDPSLNGLDEQLELRCLNSAGVQVGSAGNSDITLLPGGPQALTASTLLTAPAAGVYRCDLEAQADSLSSAMTIQTDGSWLAVSAADEFGAHLWTNPNCDSEGDDPLCTYLGPQGVANQRYLLDNDDTPLSRFTAATTATQVSSLANVELTTCGNTASCGANHAHRGSAPNSVVRSHLEVVQHNADDSICNITSTGDLTSLIGTTPHHYSIQYQLDNVQILHTCSSRNLSARISVTWVSGNTVKVDGYRPGDQDTPSVRSGDTETNAYIINSFFTLPPTEVPTPPLSTRPPAPTTAPAPTNAPAPTSAPAPLPTVVTVPNLVGHDPTTAQQQLVAGRLKVGNVTTTNNCANPGTVLNQSPAAGAVVAPATLVNFTVSTCVDGRSGS